MWGYAAEEMAEVADEIAARDADPAALARAALGSTGAFWQTVLHRAPELAELTSDGIVRTLPSSSHHWTLAP